MKLQFLGTAAYEGIPAFYCECDACKKARELGGRNMRTRSQAIVDDTILIDYPADTYAHFLAYNMPLSKIKTCIITHSHSDHFYPSDMLARFNGPYAHVNSDAPLTIYSGEDGYNKTVEKIKEEGVPECDLKAVLIKPFEPFEADGYTITALNANHAQNTSPYIFIIEKDGKAVLYGNDTWIFPEDTWEYLEKYIKKFDLVILDCTMGESPNEGKGHMNVEQCAVVRDRMCKMGLCHENTKYILNHFSHNGATCLYDDLKVKVEKLNFDVSYDGMTVEF